ncbi:HAD family hydrolase [Pseudooceanicola sp. C21-150M6]|uniref:sulfotransferase-like domain-containing protein n=1 Tax=Pseudooceanicola sp. C21-150M6 TaxID=3434355 RepID=UPI003D7F512A
MKIACWSGPRNISTALMYSFSNRADCGAVDEPFYAAYLAATGKNHPMRAEIMASQPEDPEEVISTLLQPDSTPHMYHKHMAQHMLPGIRRDWWGDMAHILLIRHPARVVASFTKGWAEAGLEDIGAVQLAGIYDDLLAQGITPVVIEGSDVRADPERMLRAICGRIGLDWDPAMLGWEAGPKAVDGLWAPVWYGAVHQSTGFAGPEGEMPVLEGDAAEMAAAAMPFYERLAAVKLVV